MAVALCPTLALLVPCTAHADDVIIAEPVTVIVPGLLAASEVRLTNGQVLDAGEVLLPGDVVEDGALFNITPLNKLVLIEGHIEIVGPGDLVITIGHSWQCFCTCNGNLTPTGHNSADCDGWAGSYIVGHPCPGGGNWSLPCQQVYVGEGP